MNPADQERLHRDGYLVVPDVLDAAMVDRLTLAFAASPARPGATQHVEIDQRTPHHDCWVQLAHHPVVCSPAQLFMGGGVVEFRAHGRNPMPGHGQQGLHADALPRQPDEPVRAVTAIWMLDPFTAENGATRVVPGTHLLCHAVPRRYAQPSAHHPDEVVITGSAGTVLVFSGHLWHSGRANDSTGSRRAVQMTTMACPVVA